VTEPDAGLDTTAIRTRARREGDSYRIDGQKIWTSRALQSDLMLLLARTSEPEPERRWFGLSTFLVDLREAGDAVKIVPIETMLNHNTNEVFIDGLEVPAENLIGEEGMGFRYILDGMNAERILIAAECVGDGHWFIDRATSHAKERVVFKRPIGQNQGVAFPIAWAYARIEAADLMRRRAAELYEAGEKCAAEANMAKLLCADASWEAANACLDTHGGVGFAREYDVERKFRETRLYQVAPVSTNMVLAYLAQNVLGLPRSY
jgi:acyl-CoA dehydrogenase